MVSNLFLLCSATQITNIFIDNGYSLGQVLQFASQNNTNVLINKYLGSVSTVDGAGSYLGMKLR
jgi:hypothetical protein